jgi:hypothetical protein
MIGSLDKERMLEYSKRYGSAIEVANAIDCHPHSVRRAAKRYGIKFTKHRQRMQDGGEEFGAHSDYLTRCTSCGEGHRSTPNGLCFSCYARERRNA